MSKRTSRAWLSVCHACAGGVSVICMSSMGAALAGAVGAGAAGMAGMGGMATGRSFTVLSRLMEAVGLGILNRLPDVVLRPTLVAILILTVGATFLGFLGHRRPQVLLLTLAGAALMYPSIYLWMSEPLYFVSLVGLLAGGLWGIFLARALQGPSASAADG